VMRLRIGRLTEGLVGRPSVLRAIERIRDSTFAYGLIDRAALTVAVILRFVDQKDRQIRLYEGVKDFTMLPYHRLMMLHDSVAALLREGVGGDFVQCGVWNGGSAAVIANALGSDSTRSLWLLDSFAGMPSPSSIDVDPLQRGGQIGLYKGTEEIAQSVVSRHTSLSPDRIRFVTGWFQETAPRAAREIEHIALLHVDCDFYESVKTCLETFVPLVSPGGLVVVDDYGDWQGCRAAFDSYLQQNPFLSGIRRIDHTAVFATVLDRRV
jgi:O-methyltransferase